jgi:hypothetical protein
VIGRIGAPAASAAPRLVAFLPKFDPHSIKRCFLSLGEIAPNVNGINLSMHAYYSRIARFEMAVAGERMRFGIAPSATEIRGALMSTSIPSQVAALQLIQKVKPAVGPLSFQLEALARNGEGGTKQLAAQILVALRK